MDVAGRYAASGVSVGATRLSALPLDVRQREEFFLTAAQSLFGIALLLRLRLGVASALTLTGLFAMQVALAFHYRNDQARTITTLTWLAWIYLGLAAVVAGRQYPTAHGRPA